jgi:hypothetical protein
MCDAVLEPVMSGILVARNVPMGEVAIRSDSAIL